MYDIFFSNQFKRSYKKCIKRGCNKVLFDIPLIPTTPTKDSGDELFSPPTTAANLYQNAIKISYQKICQSKYFHYFCGEV